MNHLRAWTIAAGCLVLAIPAGAATPVSDVDVLLQKIPSGLIVEPIGGDGIDEVCVSLPKGAAPTGVRQVTRADAGWRLDTSTRGRACARRERPQGPRPVIFELAEVPRAGRYDVTLRGGGEVLFRRQGIAARVLAPVAAIADPAAVLDLPKEATPGEVVLAQVLEPDALPAGGAWTFGGGIRGVVLEAETSPAEGEEGGTDEMEPEADEEFSEVIVVTGTRASPQRAAKATGGSGSVIGYVLDRDDLETVAAAIEDRSRLVLFVPTAFGANDRPPGAATFREGDPVPGEDPLEQPSGGGGSGGGGGGGSGSADPCVVKPGSDPDPDLLKSWESLCPGVPKPEIAAGRPRPGRPEAVQPGPADAEPPVVPVVPAVPVRVTYTDRYGRTLVDGEIEVTPVPSGDEGVGPAIVSGTGMTFAGQRACVCGVFPSPRSWSALRLDGEPVRPLSASRTRVAFALPGGAAPGIHRVDGDPGAGFQEEDRWQVTALQLQGSLDQSQLFGGGSTTMRLSVLGTSESLAVRLRNTTPTVIALEGGDEQVATTSGGEPNTVDRTVRAVGRGGFDIEWSLDVDPCPCSALLVRQALRARHETAKSTIQNIK